MPDKQEEQIKTLNKWKEKLETSRQHWDTTIIDEREMLYNGTHDVDPNINTTSSSTNAGVKRKKANNVVNIIYEFIESAIDTTIPQPFVRSKRPEFQYLAKMIEDSTKNDISEIGLERINDENERTTSIQGLSLMMVQWNPDFKHHLYQGEIEILNPHPKQFLPQPGVYDLQKMDYFFLLYSMTKKQVKRRYGIDVSDETEQFPEINYFHDGQATTGENDKVTVIVAWYKDEEGKIGKFTWCNETVLEDLPNYFARRLQRCTKCGELKGISDTCEVCGGTNFKESIEKYETIEYDMVLSDGRVIPAGTKVPYYEPTRYPVVIRRNVPVAFQLAGQSDVDLIRDQQDALKKMVSTMEEKIIRGGNIIKALDDHQFNLTNELYQVIRGNQAQLNALQEVSLTADIQKELMVADYMYKAARDTLGITNSWMGKEDTTAKSGLAKQIQVQQTSGRLQSKQFNKYSAYADLFRIMFEFKLAYYDELRPYLYKGANGETDWGEFNKYEFLVQDADGQWFYNTDFIIQAVPGSEGLPRDKNWLMAKATEFLQYGAMDKVQFWTIMESLNFPMATEIKQAAMQEKEMLIQQQAQMDAIQGEIEQMKAMAGGGGNPIPQQGTGGIF